MKIFVTGTDTDVGKTLVSAWLCLHTKADYFKPIQSGSELGMDSDFVSKIAGNHIHPESYVFSQPLSPHLAAAKENKSILLNHISLPAHANNLVVEGAGGVMVPLSEQHLMLDLIEQLKLPVLLVCRSKLGTINHTLLSLQALRSRKITILGVIMNQGENDDNKRAIEYYGHTSVLMTIPQLDTSVTTACLAQKLLKIPMSDPLYHSLFKTNSSYE
jgi:dethiobiotin synthetase